MECFCFNFALVKHVAPLCLQWSLLQLLPAARAGGIGQMLCLSSLMTKLFRVALFWPNVKPQMRLVNYRHLWIGEIEKIVFLWRFERTNLLINQSLGSFYFRMELRNTARQIVVDLTNILQL